MGQLKIKPRQTDHHQDIGNIRIADSFKNSGAQSLMDGYSLGAIELQLPFPFNLAPIDLVDEIIQVPGDQCR